MSVINSSAAGNEGKGDVDFPSAQPSTAPVPAATAFVLAHADFVYRSVRRMGVPPSHADDATQEVFITATTKLARIEPGRERAFLFGVAMNVAAHVRRSLARKREVAAEDPGASLVDPGASPEGQLAMARARQTLDRVLDELADDVRPVFVLFELEELTMAEIATMLALPPGTVASRLRRARAEFQAAAARMRGASETEGANHE